MNQEIEGRMKPLLLLLVLLCCSGVANAQGWYMGAGFGQSGADNISACSRSLNGLDPGFSCSGNSSSTAWRVFAGYEINRNLSVEGSYVDLGEFHGSASGTLAGSNQGMATGNSKVSGFTLDAVGALPVSEQFGLIGRIGVFAWSLDATATTTSPNPTPYTPRTSTESSSGTSVDFGMGVKYDFDKNLGMRAEFQRFTNIGNDATGKSDVSLISASLVYRFRSSFY